MALLTGLLFVLSAGAAAAETPLFVLPPLADSPADYGDLGLPGGRVPKLETLRQGILPNGLEYYILENAVPKDRAYLTLAVNAGSIVERDDERGLAHFTEHMAFNGTRRFPEAELINYLRSLGMRFGPEVNAYTGYDQTVFGIETPTETGNDGVRRIPEKALAILDDWTYAVTFAPKDVDDERAVIMEEYRTRLGARDRIRQQMLPVIFRGSRYAERLPIGLPEIIQHAPASTLEGFYKTWYRPENMALILVGDFDGAALEASLASHFTAPPSPGDFSRPWYELPGPRPGNLEAAVFTDPELTGSMVYLYFKRAPKPRDVTLRSWREELRDYLIESMVYFRAEESLSLEATPYLGAQGWNSRYGRNSRYYIMAAQAKAGQIEETVRALLLEKERELRYGFTESELARAKEALLAGLEQQVAEADRRESDVWVEEITDCYLAGRILYGPQWELEAVRKLFPGITLRTVNAAAAAFFQDDDLRILVTAPADSALPGREDLLLLAAEAKRAELLPPVEDDDGVELVETDPAPGTIARETWIPAGENTGEPGGWAISWRLGNGARVILRETANKNNEVVLYALARGGTTSVSEEADLSASLAAELQSASGLGPHDRVSLLRFLSGRQVSLSFFATPYLRGFRGSSTVKDLETFFQILYLYFTQPRIDDAGFAMVLEQYRTNLLKEKENPESLFSREVTRLAYGNHPRFRPMESTDLERVNAAAALAFLHKALNPQDYTFVFVGNLSAVESGGPIPPEEELYPGFRRLVETWLASIPVPQGAAPWFSWDDPGITRPGKTEKDIYKGQAPQSIIFMGWYVPSEWNEDDNAAAMVLSEYLEIVLTDTIRESLGGVYSVSASVSLSPLPSGELAMGVYFICDPRRESELRQAVKEQLAVLSRDGFDGETFRRAQEAVVKTFEQSMESNSFIARNYANFEVLLRTPLAKLPLRPGLYRSVTVETVTRVLRAVLEGGPAELVLYPDSADK